MKVLPHFRTMPFLLSAIFAVPDASSQLLKKSGSGSKGKRKSPDGKTRNRRAEFIKI